MIAQGSVRQATGHIKRFPCVEVHLRIKSKDYLCVCISTSTPPTTRLSGLCQKWSFIWWLCTDRTLVSLNVGTLGKIDQHLDCECAHNSVEALKKAARGSYLLRKDNKRICLESTLAWEEHLVFNVCWFGVTWGWWKPWKINASEPTIPFSNLKGRAVGESQEAQE